MSIQHKSLASGSWNKMELAEQMANVGSELERALSWKKKHNKEYSDKAVERMLELLSLTKNVHSETSKLKEIARVYELLVDYFIGNNRFNSTSKAWRKYFGSFTYLAAKNRLV
jgi:hypothetical protein